MSESSSSYLQQLKALLPRGALWQGMSEEGKLFGELLSAIANEFARVDASNAAIIDEVDPRTTYQLLAEWEGFAGLPGECLANLERTLQERRDTLLERLTDTGGCSRAYIIARAAELGHAITITETVVSISGELQAGDELSAAMSDIYYWQVNVPVENTYAFVSGVSEAGDELGYWQPIRLECLLELLKPAHTQIIWNYTV